MKITEALKTNNANHAGFYVSFEWIKDGILESDHFPDFRNGEKPLTVETEAWDAAYKFAKLWAGQVCNITVTTVSAYDSQSDRRTVLQPR